MPPLDALLFDLGGTLDGRGGWRQRFQRLLPEAGVECSRAACTAAFDYAEARSHDTPAMATLQLAAMVRCHVGWQLEHLGAARDETTRAIADRFVADVMAAAAINRGVLADLAGRGFTLGVVSNACGNAAALCVEYGYAPLLSAIVDSHEFGAAKPDPSIFERALALVGADAGRTGFVGDTLDRDIAPAKALGMTTFWVAGTRAASAAAADVVIDTVADLPAVFAAGPHLRRRPGGGLRIA